jgi:hypothetical protein
LQAHEVINKAEPTSAPGGIAVPPALDCADIARRIAATQLSDEGELSLDSLSKHETALAMAWYTLRRMAAGTLLHSLSPVAKVDVDLTLSQAVCEISWEVATIGTQPMQSGVRPTLRR